MKYICFLCLSFVLCYSFAQVRKAELSVESGYQDNFFKSPELLRQSDSLLYPEESGFFLGVAGELDLRLQWGTPIKRNTQKHQLDLYHTLRTRQFPQLRDASTVWGDIQGTYRLRTSKAHTWLVYGGYTHFLTPEMLKTPERNIISYGYQRWEVGSGWEFTGVKNHLSRVSLIYLDKDYTYQNSLDRKELAGKWYARQRFRNAFGKVSYLRLSSYILYRSYDNTRGSGVDEEGFEVVVGNRQLLQLQTELSYEYPLRDGLDFKPGIQFRYRNDIFPDRFDYQQFRPFLSLQYDKAGWKMNAQAGYTIRRYKEFRLRENPSDRLQYRYLALHWEGVYTPRGNDKILPYWRIDWNSRSSNAQDMSRINFRAYKSWAAVVGLRVKWE